jgi:hypothetical protein
MTNDWSDTNDVEKRWHDPRAARAAITYVAVVVALAGVAFAVFALGDRDRVDIAVATPGVLFLGALGAFVKTYRDWRARRTWPIWQAAGWFLLAVSLLTFGVPAGAALS